VGECHAFVTAFSVFAECVKLRPELEKSALKPVAAPLDLARILS